MPAAEAPAENLPSLLDRLIDLEPKNRDSRDFPTQSLRQLKASLRRDLEWLLNARRCPEEPPEDAENLRRSVFYYGLPDVSHYSLASSRDQHGLCRLIEQAVAHYEPRLAGVRVGLKPIAPGSRVLRFLIEGLFRIEPAPERLLFDTTLEMTSGQYEVGGESGAG